MEVNQGTCKSRGWGEKRALVERWEVELWEE